MYDFKLDDFLPARGLHGRHQQTLWAHAFLRPHNVQFRRHRLETPDGDFIDIDRAEVNGRPWESYPDGTPIVLVLHGIEGSAESNYMRTIYHGLANVGLRAVGINYRTCSGEMNRTLRFYNARATDDVALVHDWLQSAYANTPIGLIGISLGASLTLNYLGEHNGLRGDRVAAAVSISPFFDLPRCIDVMDGGSGRLYAPTILRSLKRKVRMKAHQLAGVVDVRQVLASKTIRQYDNRISAPLLGFADADELYRWVSPTERIPDISAPTLILRAIDDPFFDPDAIPFAALAANEQITAGLPEHGGHVGFVDSYFGLSWAVRMATQFLQHQFARQGAVTLAARR